MTTPPDIRTLPAIKKCRAITGRTLRLRNATVADAPFIFQLRTDAGKSRFMSSISDDIRDQENWLSGYAQSQGQAYFIIENSDRTPVGTVRLYDAKGNSFCWGSWILAGGAPAAAAIESALIVYVYALDHLGFSSAHFQVHKMNESVWKFHERFGAARCAEDQTQYEYTLANAAIRDSLRKYSRYLPQGIIVEGLES